MFRCICVRYAGQEKFRTITYNFYRGASCVVYVYDVSNIDSFLALPKWMNDIQQAGNTGIHTCLVGNKVDLAEQRAVMLEQGQQLAERHNMMFLETSAKSAVGVQDLFQNIAKNLTEQQAHLPVASAKSSVIAASGATPITHGRCAC
jgi:GTPase SAR1 family protein